MKNRIIAAFAAAVFIALSLCSGLPAFAREAEPGVRYNTPSGYNSNDYQKMVTFLELKDSSGVKNGRKLSSSYSPTSPNTWTGIEWSGSRLSVVDVYSKGLVGSLDLSGCAELFYLGCASNSITEIDVSGCGYLEDLFCSNNQIASLNVSGCSSLAFFSCDGNRLTLIDLTTCPAYNLKLRAAGNGWVGLKYEYEYDEDWDEDVPVDYYIATPKSGASFIGWYTESGAFVSSSMRLKASSTSVRSLVARFTGWNAQIPGDADGNGTVDTTDALIVLRAALGISGSVQSLLSNCDMDGSGVLDTADALMILRLALNIG